MKQPTVKVSVYFFPPPNYVTAMIMVHVLEHESQPYLFLSTQEYTREVKILLMNDMSLMTRGDTNACALG